MGFVYHPVCTGLVYGVLDCVEAAFSQFMSNGDYHAFSLPGMRHDQGAASSFVRRVFRSLAISSGGLCLDSLWDTVGLETLCETGEADEADRHFDCSFQSYHLMLYLANVYGFSPYTTDVL